MRTKEHMQKAADAKSPRKKALTSTERSRNRRNALYADSRKHAAELSKDSARKRSTYRAAAYNRQSSMPLVLENREKEKIKKQKYRAKQAALASLSAPSNVTAATPATPTRIRKNAQRTIRRKKDAVIRNLEEENEALQSQIQLLSNTTEDGKQSELDDSEPSDSEPDDSLLVSRSLWNSLSPPSRKRSKTTLEMQEHPVGFNQAVRREIGINLSNKVSYGSNKSKVAKEIEKFFDQDDVTRICPDKKAVMKNPDDKTEKVPARYRLSSLSFLHKKFVAQTDEQCDYTTFTRHVPYYVSKPSPQSWGTCICGTCLNPELKLKALSSKLKVLKKEKERDHQTFQYSTEEISAITVELDSDSIADIIKIVETMKLEGDITFTEWKSVANPLSKKGGTVSRKMQTNMKFSEFFSVLIKQLNIMMEHLKRCHIQFSAFKKARLEAVDNAEVATIQMDWSENPKLRQAKEERSAYYIEDQVCLHAIHLWTAEGTQSMVACSDCTDHRAEAVIASVKPLIVDLAEKGKKLINAITDSPLNQYRNRKIFWLIQQLAQQLGITIRWIFLESGHGKGIPDGIGAVVKRQITDLIASKPDSAFYTVAHLLQHGLADLVPSISLSQYSKEDIAIISATIPDLHCVKGTLKLHEVQTHTKDGKQCLLIKDTSDQKPRCVSMTLVKKATKKTTKKTMDSIL